MTALLLAVLIVFAPHGDDETTMIPTIRDTEATVVIVTDSAGTGWCKPELGGPGQWTAACEQMRRDATTGFLGTVAPATTLGWAGLRDGSLTRAKALAVIDSYCRPVPWRSFSFDEGKDRPVCDIRMAGATEKEGYLHPDHLALEAAVVAAGGSVWDGVTYWDEGVYAAMLDWYGWLLGEQQYALVGLEKP